MRFFRKTLITLFLLLAVGVASALEVDYEELNIYTGNWDATRADSSIDDTFLRLDAANDPITGSLGIGEGTPADVELYIAGDVGISEDLTVGGTATITGDVSTGELTVGGTDESIVGTTYPDVKIDFNEHGAGQLELSDDVTITGDFTVSGTSATFAGDVTLSGSTANLYVEGDADVTGDVIFNGTDGLYWEAANARLSVGGTENTITINGATALGQQFTTHNEGVTDVLDVGLNAHNDTALFGTTIGMSRSRGDTLNPTTIVDDDTISRIISFGYDGTDYAEAARIDVYVDGALSDGTDMPGRMVFATTPDGAGTATDRMTILSNGNVGIGDATPSYELEIAGSAYLSGDITVSGAGFSDTVPTRENEWTNKKYVDNLVGGLIVNYFLSDTATGEASPLDVYNLLYAVETGEVSSTVSSTIDTDPKLIKAYITESTEPTFTILNVGTYVLYTHANVDAVTGYKDATVYFELYSRTIGGTETLLATSHNSDVLTTSASSVILHANLSTQIVLASTDRLVVKIYGDTSGAGVNPQVTIHMEGDNDCRVGVFTTNEANEDRFVNVAGDAMTGAFTGTTVSLSSDLTVGGTLFGTASTGDDLLLNPISGNVGIHNTMPEYHLDIRGRDGIVTDYGIRVDLDGESNDIPIRVRTSSLGASYVTDADTKFLLNGAGNLAVGDTAGVNPTHNLEVTGDGFISDTLELGSELTISGTTVFLEPASHLFGETKLFSMTIYDPDTIQPNKDAVVVFPVEEWKFPYGIKLLAVGIKTDTSSTYVVNFEEWTSPSDGSPSTIASVTTSSSTEAQNVGALTDSDIAAGSIIEVDLPATDIIELNVWGIYYIKKPGE